MSIKHADIPNGTFISYMWLHPLNIQKNAGNGTKRSHMIFHSIYTLQNYLKSRKIDHAFNVFDVFFWWKFPYIFGCRLLVHQATHFFQGDFGHLPFPWGTHDLSPFCVGVFGWLDGWWCCCWWWWCRCWLIVDCLLLIVDSWLLIVDCWLLIVDCCCCCCCCCWLIVVVGWLLLFLCWLTKVRGNFVSGLLVVFRSWVVPGVLLVVVAIVLIAVESCWMLLFFSRRCCCWWIWYWLCNLPWNTFGSASCQTLADVWLLGGS